MIGSAMEFVLPFILLLGILVFVHELGHFLVAKACGVRVLKFSLGFGPPVSFGSFKLQWKRGHTEYVVAWFPLGGFVKMLGENFDESDDPDVRAHPSETLGSKPLWQKLAIVFAGPAMNLALPVVVFAGTLFVGLPRPDAVIGTVQRGSPAAEAGLLAGDRITAVDGESVRWWSDFVDLVRGRPGAEIDVGLERAGEPLDIAFPIGRRQVLDEFGRVQETSWVGVGYTRVEPELGVPERTSPAWAAGLRTGDRVVAIGGREIEDWGGLAAAYTVAAAPIGVRVERGPEDARETLPLELPALGDLDRLGVTPADSLIAFVEPDSPAARAGIAAGDLIVTSDGEPIPSFGAFAQAVGTGGGTPVEVGFSRDGEIRQVTLEPELIETDVGMGIEEERYRIGIVATGVLLQGALAVDQERNLLVAVPRAFQMTVDLTQTFLRGLGLLITGEASHKQLAGPIGIAEIAGRAFQAGWDTYLRMLALISINLGILNLLPIPILDGGQALIFATEGIRRAPLSLRTREIVQQVGLVVLMMIIGLAFWNDIARNWARVVDWLQGAG